MKIKIWFLILLLLFIQEFKTENNQNNQSNQNNLNNLNENQIKIISSIDYKTYIIVNDNQQEQSLNILYIIRKLYNRLRDYLKINYSKDYRVKLFSERYNDQTILQETNDKNKVSYSQNKGELISLCLRSLTNQFENINTIKFVAIHELAHIITDDVGHTEQFNKNFRFLLSHSIKLGLYQEIDYRRNPTHYCGTIINYSPPNLSNERKMKSYL